jgi:hypothetical protein
MVFCLDEGRNRAEASYGGVGSKGIQRRKPYRPLPKLRGRPLRTEDEPPVMWSPGFEASPNSPAGYTQAWWRLTGRGSRSEEDDAKKREWPMGRVGRAVLRLLGYRRGAR